eukprot:391059-Amphidinium_carterae.1
MEQAVAKRTTVTTAGLQMALGHQSARTRQLSAQTQTEQQTIQMVATAAVSFPTYHTRGVVDQLGSKRLTLQFMYPKQLQEHLDSSSSAPIDSAT